MKTAFLSDIHANVEALIAVLESARGRGADRFVCLGDCVGYGAEPEKCFQILIETCDIIVAGNHDLAAAGTLDTSRFSEVARASTEYTKQRLSRGMKQRLAELPPVVVENGLVFCHASPVQPLSFPYIRDLAGATDVFEQSDDFRLALYGHTHQPMAFSRGPDGEVRRWIQPQLTVAEDTSVFCNIGSVGQPRDHDPRASYALLNSDDNILRLHRVDYDVDATADKIERAGLPQMLSRRLTAGI